MKLSEFYGPEKFGLSFELFPPKSAAKEAELFSHLDALMRFRPSYVTCTYGAGGSTQQKTLDIIAEVKRRHGVRVASHLTCVGATREQLRSYLTEAGDRGVDAIVALRGDPPKGETQFKQTEGGLRYASELVAMIREEFPRFGMAVAGYPEVHIEAPNADVDLANLKRKVESGADVVVTQLFYNNDDFYRFRDRYEAAGISVPLVPGILPVTNFAQVKRITALCGAKLPQDFIDALTACGDDAESQFKVGVDFAIRQVEDLIAAKSPGMHFYVLNQSEATCKLLDSLDLPHAVAVG
ncbi:MAG TPA: methylenetetrahydrofolate reductase [NAD(P)H] [Pirellulales bacterium]